MGSSHLLLLLRIVPCCTERQVLKQATRVLSLGCAHRLRRGQQAACRRAYSSSNGSGLCTMLEGSRAGASRSRSYSSLSR